MRGGFMRNGSRTNGRGNGDVLKGLAAGVIGGLVASFVMEEFQALWSKVSESIKEAQGEQSSSQSDGEAQSSGTSQEQQGQQGEQRRKPTQDGGEESATVKAAGAISENVFGRELEKDEKGIAGEVVHYAMGATSGAIYGAMAELVPFVTVGAVLPFGAAVWLVAAEAAVPALDLSKSPTEYPLSKHAYALASHFVYSLTTDVVRRALRSTLLN